MPVSPQILQQKPKTKKPNRKHKTKTKTKTKNETESKHPRPAPAPNPKPNPNTQNPPQRNRRTKPKAQKPATNRPNNETEQLADRRPSQTENQRPNKTGKRQTEDEKSTIIIIDRRLRPMLPPTTGTEFASSAGNHLPRPPTTKALGITSSAPPRIHTGDVRRTASLVEWCGQSPPTLIRRSVGHHFRRSTKPGPHIIIAGELSSGPVCLGEETPGRRLRIDIHHVEIRLRNGVDRVLNGLGDREDWVGVDPVVDEVRREEPAV